MITVQNVSKTFEDTVALSGINCTIPEGSIYGMVGSNGAGKSTFLRLISGVYKPDNGAILIDNMPVWDNPSAKELFVYVPDELYFMNGATMERMAKLYASVYNSFDYETFRRLSAMLNLNTRKNMNGFSKGIKRQAAIILAVAVKPKYIFLDETFDGLDPIVRKVIKGIIYEEIVERKATAIITSHSLRELEDTCDQLVLLHRGGIVFEKDVESLKTSHFKVQIALDREYDESDFSNLEVLNFTKKGTVASLIVKGEKQETVEKLNALNPVVLDILPLSLEEVFTYEMGMLGYDFSIFGEVQGNEANF